MEYFTDGKWLKDIRFWATIIVLALVIWYFKSCNKPTEPVKMDFEKGEQYKDEKGNEHTTYPVAEVSKEQMKRIKDSIARTIKGEVIYITQTVTKVDTVFVDRKVIIDSTKKTFMVKQKDPYLDLTISGNWETKKANVGITMVDTLTHTVVKRKRFLRSNELLVDIQHANPYTQSMEGRSFMLKERKPLVSLGVTAAYGFSKNGLTPFVGLGVTLPVITLYTK